MGVTISSNFDDLGDFVTKHARESAENFLVEKLVGIAREKGLHDVSQIDLTITGDDDGALDIDEASVKQRANAILAAE